MKMLKDSSLVGMALFAMFFGAGNIIFPPIIGVSAGNEWPLGLLCYYMADVGLGLVALFAMLRGRNIDQPEGIMFRLGKIPGRLMMGAAILCIGPLLAIPRTCAAAFEMSLAPLVGNEWLGLFSVIYFFVVLALSIRETAVVDVVGRYLTPLLVMGLLAMIVTGIFYPIGPIADSPQIDNVVWFSITSGYQTLDVLATLVFGLIIANALKAKGYVDEKSKFTSVGTAGLVAGLLLLFVYGGLCYLGATASTIFTKDTNLAQLTLGITNLLFGQVGVIILGITVSLACITTAVALVGATGIFFMSISGGKLHYKMVAIVVCVFSAIGANFGLSAIISFAVPILTIIYPAALVVVVLSLFNTEIKNDNIFRFATVGALLASTAHVLNEYGFMPDIIRLLPFFDYGFGWVVPAIIFGFMGMMCKPRPKVAQ